MHHPWRAFGHLAEWTLRWVDLPGDLLGLTLHDHHEVLLTLGMTQAERRSTIEHERQHVLRGPAAPGLEAREELRVRKETARMLLPDVRRIGEALAWANCLDEAADELWVDTDTLSDRLQHLHPAERHYLRRRLDQETPDAESA